MFLTFQPAKLIINFKKKCEKLTIYVYFFVSYWILVFKSKHLWFLSVKSRLENNYRFEKINIILSL